MNDWYEVCFNTTFEYSEIFEQLLLGQGAGGVTIDDPALQSAMVGRLLEADEPLPYIALSMDRQVAVKGYFNGARDIDVLTADLTEKASAAAGSEQWKLTVLPVSEEDWAHAWKQYFHSFKTGKCFRIIPSWEREKVVPESGEIPLLLDPGMAFGTGSHPTTALCLEALTDHIKTGDVFIDIGTGSGILAIAAANLGAAGKAIDIDPVAVDTARRNIAENGVAGSVETFLCDIKEPLQWDEHNLVPGGFDLVIANIVAEVLVRLMPEFKKLMGSHSVLLLSGIIAGKLDSVLDAIHNDELEVIKVYQSEDWRALAVRNRHTR